MRTFKLTIDMGNQAFQDDPLEVAHILRDIADRMENAGGAPSHFLTIFDSNGNDVGRYAAKERA